MEMVFGDSPSPQYSLGLMPQQNPPRSGQRATVALEAYLKAQPITWVVVPQDASGEEALQALLRVTQSCVNPMVTVAEEASTASQRSAPDTNPETNPEISPETYLEKSRDMTSKTRSNLSLGSRPFPKIHANVFVLVVADDGAPEAVPSDSRRDGLVESVDGPILGILTAADLLQAYALGLNLADLGVQLLMTPWADWIDRQGPDSVAGDPSPDYQSPDPPSPDYPSPGPLSPDPPSPSHLPLDEKIPQIPGQQRRNGVPEPVPERLDLRPGNPAIDHSAIENTTIDRPAIDHSTIESTPIENTTIDRPPIENTTIDRPTIDHPPIENTTIDHPTIDRPTIEEAQIEEAAINHSSIDRPTIEETPIYSPTISPPSSPPDREPDHPEDQTQITLLEHNRLLQNSQTKLLTLLNASLCGFIAVDAEGNILFTNPTAQHLLGLGPDDLSGWQLGIPLVNPDQGSQELKVRNALGQWSIVTMEVASILWNQKPAWLMSWIDITELKTKESALQQQETYQRLLLENMPVGILIQDANTKIVYANGQACQFLRQPLDSLLGLTLQDLHYRCLDHQGNFLPIEQCPIHQVIATETPLQSMEVGLELSPGTVQWLLINACPVMDEMGILSQVVTTFVDMNPVKLAQQRLQNFNQILEEQVTQRTAALQEKNLFIEHITETSPDILYIYDLEQQKTIYTNRDITALLGYSPAESAALGHGVLNTILHPDDRESVQQHHHVMRRMKDVEVQEIEYRLRDRQGNWRWFSSRETLFVSQEQGLAKQIIGSTSEITARKALETQLRQRNTELAEANRLKDQFLAAISHELRTPLNAILGMVEGLMDGVYGDLGDRHLSPLQTISQNGWHLLQMISDLLTLAEIEACSLALKKAAVDLTELCTTSLKLIRPQAQQKRVALASALHPAPLPVDVDAQQIQKLLLNLLNNGIKFTPSGGQVTLHSAYQLWPGPDPLAPPPLILNTPAPPGTPVCCLSIEDTGIGIPMQQLPHLFQPFVQGDGGLNRNYSGTGIGLALVKQILDLHQGWLQIWSTIDQGSRFSVYLPCQALEVETNPQRPSPKLHPSPSPLLPADSLDLSQVQPLGSDDRSKVRILLVEDNEANLASASDYLNHRGYQIRVARTGREALSQVHLHPPDLIVMDLQMPDMDGLEILKHLRNHSRFRSIPILVVTALASSQSQEHCLQAGATAYLPKPVRLKELAAAIQRYLTQP